MTKADLEKLAFSLLSKYSSLYSKKYGSSPNINKYKEKWGMKSLVEDYGDDTVLEVLSYYFDKTSRDRHPLNWFYSNFDSLLDARNSLLRDKELRKQRRQEMDKIRQEYLNGYA